MSNFGNFSHRVQPSGSSQAAGSTNPNPGSGGVMQPGLNMNQTSVPSTKKQILKNLKQIKTNNEDYFIMQNISNQMGGKLTDSLYNPL